MNEEAREDLEGRPEVEISATFCEGTRVDASRVQAMPAPAVRGGAIGRYVTLSILGAGGMGIVYAAYDPELERKIALKLLKPSAVSLDVARLLREARALARVAHPNVVSVFDVGTLGGDVFIAMEFIEGLTLSRWLRQRKRSFREILDVFAAAARGLAAAHRASVIHRDFKPDNVMVDDAGRVRVLDFGLARAGHGPPSDASLEQTLVSGSGPSSTTSLTLEGSLLGTPAYMAPEQWHGAAVSPSTDQFAFCVALYEALFGRRPFRGETTSALMLSVTAGKLDKPGDRRVPQYLRRLLERGLSLAPERRFASMDELLAALERGPVQQRRRILAIGLCLTALIPGAMLGLRAQRITACEAAGAEISGVWSDSAKQSLRANVVATGVSYASDSYDKAVGRIDAWTQQWSALRTEVCREATVDGTRTPELHTLAVECLEERRDGLAGMLAVFGEGVAADVERLAPAAAGLERLEPCADDGVLARRPRLPEDLQVRGEVESLRADLRRTYGLWLAGRYQPAMAAIESQLPAALAVGYVPLAIEARMMFGRVAAQLDHFERAEEAYRRAYLDAGGLGLDEAAAQAALKLVHLVGEARGRPEEGLQWALSAEMFVRRLGQERGLIGASLLINRAQLTRGQGEFEAALADQQRALEIREELLGPDHPDVAIVLGHIANIQRDRGKHAEALAAHDRVLAIREQALGPNHPAVAAALNDLALLQQVRGKYEEARVLLERSLVVVEAAWGPDGLDASTVLNNLGRVHHMRGAYADAESMLERARAIRERRLGPDHLELATTLQYLGLLHLVRGDRIRARDLLEQVLAIRQKHFDATHPEILNIQDSLGTVYYRIGAYDQARAMHEQALAGQRIKFGPRHSFVAHSLRNLALVDSALGRHDAALAGASEALALGEAVLGAEHPDIATFLNTRGSVLRGHDGPAAEVDLRRALALSLRTRGPKHPGTAMSMLRLGEVLLDRGALDEAEEQFRKALTIREDVRHDSPEVAEVLFDLGVLALARARPDQAVAPLERAARLRDHPGVPAHELAAARAALARALATGRRAGVP